jgi:inosine-uridine nucleoside N-ribohydrolase
LSAATGFLRESYERRRLLSPGEGVRYNDLPAVAYAIDPGLFAVSRAKVEVETGDENRGQTVADWNSPEPNVGVCLEVGAGAVTEMFTRRVSESFATL